MPAETVLWTEKHFPGSFEQFVGNPELSKTVQRWAMDWRDGKRGKPLLLHGAPGVGKTCIALLTAKCMDWSVFELNASDFRTKDLIERLAGSAAHNASFDGRLRLILLDEVDGLQGTVDRGGAAAINEIIQTAQNPVILTANDVFGEQKLQTIRTHCTVLEFRKPNYLSVAKFLRIVCEKEGIDFDQESLGALAKNSSSDIRAALLDLQSIAGVSKKITLEDVQAIGFRERETNVFDVLRKIFNATDFDEARNARFSSDVSDDLLNRWIEENIPRVYHHPLDTANAFEALSRADIFNGRVMRRQHYGFWRYSGDLSSAGVALAKQKPYHEFVMFQFPSLIKGLGASKGARALKKSIAEKMQEHVRASRRELMADIPYYQALFENKQKALEWTALFDFSAEELSLLTGKKKDSKLVKELLAQSADLRKQVMVSKRKPLEGISQHEIPAMEGDSGEDDATEKPEPIAEQARQTRLF